MTSEYSKFYSTKLFELGSCCFRQPKAQSHCRHLHGYRLTAKIWFKCISLDNNNWVVDFGGLKELRNILEMQFDHTTIIAKDDPLLPELMILSEKDGCNLRVMDGVGIEKFAEWCYKTANSYIQAKTEGRCSVFRVEVWEHEKNSAVYGAL